MCLGSCHEQAKFFIDTDTATDDAVALVMALQHPDVDVLGISTVAGNCTIEQATQNALYTRDLVGSTVPVPRRQRPADAAFANRPSRARQGRHGMSASRCSQEPTSHRASKR